MASGDYRLLFIAGSREDLWQQALIAAAQSIGRLCGVTLHEALRKICEACYDLVLVDDLEVDDLAVLMRDIQRCQPGARVVVFTAIPTWQRARTAFNEGVTDYIKKSTNREEIVSALKAALSKSAPQPRRMTEKRSE